MEQPLEVWRVHRPLLRRRLQWSGSPLVVYQVRPRPLQTDFQVPEVRTSSGFAKRYERVFMLSYDPCAYCEYSERMNRYLMTPNS